MSHMVVKATTTTTNPQQHTMSVKLTMLATVSRGFSNRESVRTISNKDPENPVVAVDFYGLQSWKDEDKDDKYFNCQAVFFRNQARTALDNLKPGTTVLLTGELFQTKTEKDGKMFVNNDVRNATFEIIPGNQSDSSADSFNPEEFERSGPQRAGNQRQQRQQGGPPQPAAIPSPRGVLGGLPDVD